MTWRTVSQNSQEDSGATDKPIVSSAALEDQHIVRLFGELSNYIILDAPIGQHVAHNFDVMLAGKSYAVVTRGLGLGLSGMLIVRNVMSEGTAITSPESDLLNHARTRYAIHSASTTPDATETSLAALRPRVTALLADAEYEDLETGVDSTFSQGLAAFIRFYGVSAIGALREALETRLPSTVVMSVLLRELGYLSDEQTRRERRELLTTLLRSNSLQVRYVASAGLAALDDPEAIPALERALAKETHGPAREQLQMVLDQLRDTRRVSLSHR